MPTLEMPALVFLLDVDDTLLDNDDTKRHMEEGVVRLLGARLNQEFWSIYEEVREVRGVVDLPVTLKRFQVAHPNTPMFPHVAQLILSTPGPEEVYPGALEVLAHLKSLSTTVIVSDGDEVFQPAKIARSGLADAVDQRVLVLQHKVEEVQTILDAYPARHYAIVDDKPFLLAGFKAALGDRATTFHVRQGHYATQLQPDGSPYAVDHSFASIRDLATLTFEQAIGASG